MTCIQSRFTSCAINNLLSVLLYVAGVSAANAASTVPVDCPVTLPGVFGTRLVQELRVTVEKAQMSYQPNTGVVPEELAFTASETLPLFRREGLLNPVRPKPQVVVDAYYGSDYAATSPDVYILPKDARIFCLFEPGRAVFLSDDVTHHYAIVDDIDLRRRVVTLVDPWAFVSFLLPGHNYKDVKARAYRGGRGQPLLDLTFDEFLRVLGGSVEGIVPDQFFQAFEKLYPELARREDYLVWKYTRLLASDDFTTSLMIISRSRARRRFYDWRGPMKRHNNLKEQRPSGLLTLLLQFKSRRQWRPSRSYSRRTTD